MNGSAEEVSHFVDMLGFSLFILIWIVRSTSLISFSKNTWGWQRLENRTPVFPIIWIANTTLSDCCRIPGPVDGWTDPLGAGALHVVPDPTAKPVTSRNKTSRLFTSSRQFSIFVATFFGGFCWDYTIYSNYSPCHIQILYLFTSSGEPKNNERFVKNYLKYE